MVYYSKKHVDIAKGIAVPEEPQYYTVAEAMEQFNLTRDQPYHYAKYHNPKGEERQIHAHFQAWIRQITRSPKIE